LLGSMISFSLGKKRFRLLWVFLSVKWSIIRVRSRAFLWHKIGHFRFYKSR
jgi:hypothetical protein